MRHTAELLRRKRDVVPVTPPDPTSPPPPDPTSAPTSSEVTASSITVSWAAVTGATGYVLQRSTSPTSGFVNIYSGASLTFADTVAASTSYYYRYASTSSGGQSVGWSPVLGPVTTPAPTIPADPTAAPTAGDPTNTTVTISWSAASDATGYVLQRSTSATSGFTQVYKGANRTFADTGLTASTKYYYRLATTNAAGQSTGWSPNLTVTTDAPPVAGTVQPFSALKLRQMSGMNIHFSVKPWIEYQNVPEVIAALKRMGVTWVRGKADPGTNLSDEYAAALRKAGIGWCMTTASSSESHDVTVMANRVREIATSPDYAAVCIALEGLNEPNNGAVPPAGYGYADWAEWAVDMTRAQVAAAAKYPVLKGVKIVGPALHQLAVKASKGKHYQMLVDYGIKPMIDECGLHAYPNGLKPTNNMDMRIKYITDAFGVGFPIRMTEFGYTTTNTVASGNTTTPKALGVYGPRAYLQLAIRLGIPMAWYELLDDVDPTGNDIQAHYGLINTPSTNPITWTDKPVIATVGDLLNGIADPAGTAAYTPAKVNVTVTSGTADIAWDLVATKAQSDAGTASVFVYRDVSVATGVTNLTVEPVKVTITDRLGSRTSGKPDTFPDVGAEVVRVDLR